MVIHDRAKFMASLPDWSILDGCFSGKIRPTDIDGCVQRGKRVLFLEHKGKGAIVKTGQLMTFTCLAMQGNTVIAFWTDDDEKRNVTAISIWSNTLRPSGIVKNPSLETLRRLCAEWYAATDAEYEATKRRAA